MIVEHKHIDLFGELLFEKVKIKGRFKKNNPMPDEACFLHVAQGSYHSISEDDRMGLTQGQSLLMKCGNYLSQMTPDHETGYYEAIAVHFHPEVLQKIYEKDPPPILFKKKKSIREHMAFLNASPAIKKYVEDIQFYLNNPELANEEILILKVKEIILLLMQTENAPKIIRILENLFNPRTVHFKTIVEAHIFTDLDLTEFAQLTNMSLSSFKRKFKQTYNRPPLEYILNKRLEKAKELLIVADATISEIAYDCCFKTPSHFSTKFKEKFGCTPTRFRATR